jgi:hypothetical protein
MLISWVLIQSFTYKRNHCLNPVRNALLVGSACNFYLLVNK